MTWTWPPAQQKSSGLTSQWRLTAPAGDVSKSPPEFIRCFHLYRYLAAASATRPCVANTSIRIVWCPFATQRSTLAHPMRSLPIQTVCLTPNRGSTWSDSTSTSTSTSIPPATRTPSDFPQPHEQLRVWVCILRCRSGTTTLPLIHSVDEIMPSQTQGATEPRNGPTSPHVKLLATTPLLRLALALSMPVASQLGHLRYPRRPPGFASPGSSLYGSSQSYIPRLSSIYPVPNSVLPKYYIGAADNHFRLSGLSFELCCQLIIHTLLQLSFLHLLDPAHEQFCAHTLQMPTASIGTMLAAVEGLNW
ncbi:Hybrid signal transduction histidine kinase [Ceratobasidium sp. AG-Ba]|nr:Hybrid signal transduction histidine kinase [Ceratobasidium sp. AG-Ba]QRW01112.1 Hybrid signal transduction histidine kinase [Ceratobasidium sp. AG-Ba]